MKYQYIYTIQYQDVDVERRLRLYTMENYLLNVAGLVADELGFGIPDLLPMGYTWIITRLNLEMRFLPKHGEQIVIETWVEQNKHLLSVRDYRIYLQQADGTRPLLGVAKSVWAILDLEKREIVNIFDQPVFKHAVDGEVLEIARPQHLLPLPTAAQATPADGDAEFGEATHVVQYADVDYNSHCNSCRYLEWMLNTCRLGELCSPFRLDINYNKELHLGELMHIRYKHTPAAVQYQLTNDKDTTCCTACLARIPAFTLGTLPADNAAV